MKILFKPLIGLLIPLSLFQSVHGQQKDSLFIQGQVFIDMSSDAPARIKVISDIPGLETETDPQGIFRLYLPRDYSGKLQLYGVGLGEMIIENVQLTADTVIERIPMFQYEMSLGEWVIHEKRFLFGLFKKRKLVVEPNRIVDEIPNGTFLFECLESKFTIEKQGQISTVDFGALCKLLVQ